MGGLRAEIEDDYFFQHILNLQFTDLQFTIPFLVAKLLLRKVAQKYEKCDGYARVILNFVLITVLVGDDIIMRII